MNETNTLLKKLERSNNAWIRGQQQIADLEADVEEWKKAWRLESAAREQAEKEIAKLKVRD